MTNNEDGQAMSVMLSIGNMNYNGYLRTWLKDIEVLHNRGVKNRVIARMLYERGARPIKVDQPEQWQISNIAAMIGQIIHKQRRRPDIARLRRRLEWARHEVTKAEQALFEAIDDE
jgi:hypothetical protein